MINELELLDPVRTVDIGTEQVHVRELRWLDALQFLQKLAAGIEQDDSGVIEASSFGRVRLVGGRLVADGDGKVVGIVTLILPDQDELSTPGAAQELFRNVPGGKVILPASDVLSATKRAKETQAGAEETQSESGKPATPDAAKPTGDAPAEPKPAAPKPATPK